MRRSIAAAFVAAATALSVLPAVAAEAAADGRGRATAALGNVLQVGPSTPRARAALQRAQQIVSGAASPAGTQDSGRRVEATLAMRDLFSALPDLSGADQQRARAVLARPTDGSKDQYGDGYRTKAKRRCEGHFCLHWVTSTSDRASARWVTRTLDTMNAVWRLEVDKLGYRRPVRDGHHGGNSLFDVYLKDVGADYLYGYCAPEYLKPGHKREASGYCVLDNDFSRDQFRARPVDSLRVTAAHEFFHAVQFGYDFKEDPWLMEATSTWMEERFADGVNDNRQYLPYGQVARPASPLDYFDPQGFNQYGNWPFFEFLSSRFGNDTVRQIWRNAAEAADGSGGQYSTQAVSSVLAGHGGFPSVFTRYAAGNLTPGRTYAEGDQWPGAARAAVENQWTLHADGAHRTTTLAVRHMASKNVVVRPGSELTGAGWLARVTVDGPPAVKQPEAYVVEWMRDGTVKRIAVPLDPTTGAGELTFDFSRDDVDHYSVTFANASTRFACRQGTNYSCRGDALDDHEVFDVRVSAEHTAP